MHAIHKTSMILHVNYLIKFKVLQLFIMRSVINFCNSVKYVNAINEYGKPGVCSTKHRY
jgi:hypothetical protein